MKSRILLSFFLILALTSLGQDPYGSNQKEKFHSVFSAAGDTTWLLTPDRKKISFQALLDSNKGNVIYVDFWASWCRPCVTQMSFSHNLKSRLKDRKIVFLYISVDQSFYGWNEAAKALGVNDSNSYIIQDAGKDPLTTAWDISSIPRYVVVSKEGKVINKDAPRPSEKMTYNYLKKISQ